MQPDRIASVAGVHVSRETWLKVERYIELLIEENQHQNLIAKSTEQEVFERHIVDSAQLLPTANTSDASWVDIGTGPGLPGIVLAILDPSSTFTLVEPRPLRVRFLEKVVLDLRLEDRVTLYEGKASELDGSFRVITGRAVANLAKFLRMSKHLSTEKTVWVLPKGKKAMDELEEARCFWHFDCSTVESVTDGRASIVCIKRVRSKSRGGMR
ncbi:MAG: 16S rRNA (guanine(527)-N(7))-methyltransferase RsmG [Sphingomonas sp.]|nr:16S rRNA (guanine(527)-N(7))-methyltransferase RsmG [Sphingomonas sp.]RZV52033.1 MAG: 16S rRNA (guanine(527)-N(7))-methyltransferase RsmG [Sphingomonadaceae bacterium]